MISIVIPAYNEEKMIKRTSTTIKEILNKEGIEHEIIFVDDGSKDKTWEQIKSESLKNKNINGLKFSKNFGKEAAIMAGLSKSKGEAIVVIDCDLQHPPQKIVEMYTLYKEGYEIVEGVKRHRGKEGIFYKLSTKIFYKIISKAIKMDMKKSSDFKLISSEVKESLLQIPEKNTFFRAMSMWVGFKSTTVEFDVSEREEGHSKWVGFQLIKYAINNITSFTTFPLQIITVFGMISVLFSFIYFLIGTLMRIKLFNLITFSFIYLFLGIIMIGLGVVGYYLSKIYEEVQGRPRYIIQEIIKGEK